MKGCALLLGSFVVGSGIGLAVLAIVWAITADEKIASAIGTGFWLISSFVIHAYVSVWAVSVGGIRWEASDPSNERTLRKLQTAEIRYAFAFGAIGGAMTQVIGAPWYLAVVAGGFLAMLGGFIGYDIKRRYKRIGFL